MTDQPSNPAPAARGSLVRDVAVLVAVGIALGAIHNAYMLGSGPGKGLSWIKVERRVVKLEDLVPSAQDPAATDPAESAQPAPGSSKPGAPQPATTGPGAVVPARPGPGTATPGPASRTLPATDAAPGERPTSGGRSNPGAEATGTAPAPPAPATSSATNPPADVPAIPESREPIEARLSVVRRLYAANAAVFVDARTAAEYAEGHIAGAVNIPFDDVFRDPGRLDGFSDRGLPVVAYCGGGDCDVSRNLAFSMIDAGHKRVLVFLDGLPAWEQAGLPVSRGTQP